MWAAKIATVFLKITFIFRQPLIWAANLFLKIAFIFFRPQLIWAANAQRITRELPLPPHWLPALSRWAWKQTRISRGATFNMWRFGLQNLRRCCTTLIGTKTVEDFGPTRVLVSG